MPQPIPGVGIAISTHRIDHPMKRKPFPVKRKAILLRRKNFRNMLTMRGKVFKIGRKQDFSMEIWRSVKSEQFFECALAWGGVVITVGGE